MTKDLKTEFMKEMEKDKLVFGYREGDAFKEEPNFSMKKLKRDIWYFTTMKGWNMEDKTQRQLEFVEDRLIVFSETKIAHYPPTKKEIIDFYEK